MTVKNCILFPDGARVKPVFKSEEDFRKFQDRFYKAVKPELDKLDRARARSWEEASHKVYF